MKTCTVCLLLLAVVGVSYQAPASAVQYYIAEVLFLIEPQAIRNYQKYGYTRDQAKKEIEGDLRYYVYQVNKLYESLSKIHLEVRSLDVQFAPSEVYDSDETQGGKLSADTGLKKFKSWLQKNDSFSKFNYDIAIILTGYDLADGANTATAGYATVEAACVKRSNIGIVELDGSYSTVDTLAHELGHSLGAFHDGDGNNCRASDGYIMAPMTSPMSKNKWSFSPCSEKYIVNYINQISRNYKSNCLKKTKAKPSYFTLKEEENRDILNREKVCQRKQTNGYFCNNEYMYKGEVKGDAICKVLWCGSQDKSGCTTVTPSDGMMCDVGKRCIKGKCKSAPSDFPTPSNLNPSCLFNDTKTTHLYSNFEGTCAHYVETRGAGHCYDSALNHRCCSSCAKHYTGIKGCEYGDRSTFCAKYANNKRSICFGEQIAMCCNVCKDFK